MFNHRQVPVFKNINKGVLNNDLHFIKKHNLIVYNNDIHNSVEYKTMLYIASQQNWYYWPLDTPLCNADLKQYEIDGHTIHIDTTLSYTRMAVWNIKCSCLSSSSLIKQKCIDYDKCYGIIQKLYDEIHITIDKKKIPRRKIITWFQENCNFFVFSDLPISMASHILITNAVNKLYIDETSFTLNIPEFLPLPYRCSLNINFNETILLIPCNKLYYTSVVFTSDIPFWKKYFKQLDKIMTISTLFKPIFGIVLNRYIQCSEKNTISTYIHGVTTDSSFDALITYFQFNATREDPSIQQQTISIIDDENLRNFIQTYNQQSENYDWSLFIDNSIIKYGTFYLQHYVVLLHKFLLNIDHKLSYDQFKRHLYVIYQNYLHILSVKNFIDKYDSTTFNAYYSVNFDSFFIYLKTLSINNISPKLNIDEILQILLSKYLNLNENTNLNDYCETICNRKRKFDDTQLSSSSSSSSQSMLSIHDLNEDFIPIRAKLDKFISAYKLAILFLKRRFRVENDIWYEFDEALGKHIHIVNRISEFPGINKLFTRPTAIQINTALINDTNSFRETEVWTTQSNFMLSTSYGVFNSITGMYSAHIPFIRFSLSRHPPLLKTLNYQHVNEEIIQYVQQTSNIMKKFENINTLYAKMIVIPALLNSGFTSDSTIIYSIMKRLTKMNIWSELSIILNYFSFNEKFIEALIYIIDNCTIIQYSTYTKLESIFFPSPSFNKGNWCEFFDNHESRIIDTNDRIKATILGMLMMKCEMFHKLTNAFMKQIPKLNYNSNDIEKYPYNPIVLKATSECMKANMMYTINVIFGTNLTKFENNIIMTVMKLLTSIDFRENSFIELMNSICNICVTNNLNRKMYVFYGPSCTGKSSIASAIAAITEVDSHTADDISEITTRAGCTSTNNVVIINEVKSVSGNLIKRITGATAIKSKVFKSQSFLPHNTTSLLIGTTNTYMNFTDGPIDIVTSERIHAINIMGVQLIQNQIRDNLLELMTFNEYFPHINTISNVEFRKSLMWIIYTWYSEKKQLNHYPPIRLDDPFVLKFQKTILLKNNYVYRILHDCDLILIRGTVMNKDKFTIIVQKYVSNKDYQIFMSDFKNFFNQNYDEFPFIQGLIQKHVYESILNNFETIQNDDSNITINDLHNRLQHYLDEADRQTAYNYFNKINSKFFKNECYIGIKFVNENIILEDDFE